MGIPLEAEFRFYLSKQDELVEQYGGKFIAIKGNTVLGAYDTELEAVRATAQEHELGTFLVQKCEPGDQAYTQTYHSRVAFA